MLSLFIAYPWLAALAGLLIGGLGWARRRWSVVAVGAIWGLYALYETGMQQRWLCTGECNIRIDLLVIYPALLLLTVIAAVRLIRPGRPTVTRDA